MAEFICYISDESCLILLLECLISARPRLNIFSIFESFTYEDTKALPIAPFAPITTTFSSKNLKMVGLGGLEPPTSPLS